MDNTGCLFSNIEHRNITGITSLQLNEAMLQP